MKPLRFGVVGTGSVALRGILPHLSQADVQDRLRLTAVCDLVEGTSGGGGAQVRRGALFHRF